MAADQTTPQRKLKRSLFKSLFLYSPSVSRRGSGALLVDNVASKEREPSRREKGPQILALWIKALHIVAVIAWMAGMLYLPRLFVYHVDSPIGSRESETFKVMERRLLKAIMNPSMIVVFVTGGLLAWMTGYWQSPWLQAKFAARLGARGSSRISGAEP